MNTFDVKLLLTLSVVVLTLAWSWRAYRNYRAFVWRTEDMTASIERDDEYLSIGLYLNLEQQLDPDEPGWLSMKINMPNFWVVSAVIVADGCVRLDTEESGSFVLTRKNVGKLSFEILDGGDNKSDDALHALWT